MVLEAFCRKVLGLAREGGRVAGASGALWARLFR